MDEHQERELAGVVERYAPLSDPAEVSSAEGHALRSELAVRLMPAVEPLARAAARLAGLAGADADDFAEGATWDLITPRTSAEVPRICMWSPELGRFETWVRRVLFRLAQDARRVHSRRPTAALPDGFDPPQPDGRPSARQEVDAFFRSPFPPEDLARMEQWEPRDRLELALLSGYWVKFRFTPAVWERVQSEYAAARGVQLPDPFPPRAFEEAKTMSACVAALAPALGYNCAALRRRWHRDFERLRTLACVAELEPP